MPIERWSGRSVGVFYLARPAPIAPSTHFKRFHDSYRRWSAGAEHRLHVLYKGFPDAALLSDAREIFSASPHTSIYVDDTHLDIGAYFVGASRSACDFVCFLNTYSEILGPDWLAKLARNVLQSDVGIVSCTGSYEAPQHPEMPVNAQFPNPHLRSNAFMLRRDRFLALKPHAPLCDKLTAHVFEHGIASMTRRVVADGLTALVVGRDGRGYAVDEWPRSRTFRQDRQSNLLVADNRTRDYDQAPLPEKRALHQMAWGDGSLGRVEIEPARAEAPDEVFVRQTFRAFLRREATDAETTEWVGYLRAGHAWNAAAEVIRRSDQARLRGTDSTRGRVFPVAAARSPVEA